MSDITGITNQSASTNGTDALVGIKATTININIDKLEAANVAVLPSKTTPVNADTFPITDTQASNVLKNLSFTNLKAFLKTYFDSLYPSGSGSSTGTNTGDNTVATAITGNPSIAVTSIDLGNADTTLSRISAGQMSIEGITIDTISAANTLTNKTMTGATNTLTARLLKSATTEVNVSAATAPTTGQVLTATGASAATWQTPSAGSVTPPVIISSDFYIASPTRYTLFSLGNGQQNFGITGLGLSTSSSSNGVGAINAPMGNTPLFSSPYISFRIFADGANTGGVFGTDFDFFVGIGDSTLIKTGGFDFTKKHIGFKVVRRSSGTISLFATQADGTTESVSSALITIAIGDYVNLSIKVNGSSSVDYYYQQNTNAKVSVNLVSNMPSVTTTLGGGILCACGNFNVATSSQFDVEGYSIQWN